jgi:prepilin-type N-terminal cleavage/methylation domain-containing protein
MRRHPARHARAGFTLIELLVVIALILFITALAVAVSLGFSGRQQTAQGAGQLQGWLFTAKQRAYRDRLVRGLRLIPDANGFVHTCQYIGQPDPFTAVQGGTLTLAPNNNRFQAMLGGDFTSVILPFNGNTADYLVLTDTSELHRIDGVTAGAGPSTVLTLGSALVTPVTATTVNYSIIRQPRPMEGEPDLQLPTNIVVDLNLSSPNTGPIDVLFTPVGGVVQSAAPVGKYVFWVRDQSLDNPTNPNAFLQGEPTLITVFARTGAVGAFPVNPDLTNGQVDYYKYLRDGRTMGM